MHLRKRNPAAGNCGASGERLAWRLDGSEFTENQPGFQSFGAVSQWIVLRIARQRGLTEPHARLVAGLAFPAALEAAE